VDKLPSESAESAAVDDKDLVLVWSGADESRHTDVLELLSEENIPARTVNREAYSLYANTHPTIEVYVPSELATRAKGVLHESEASEEAWDALADSGALEIPAEDDVPEQKTAQDADTLEETDKNALVEIWSGASAELAGMIAMSLRENEIAYQGYPQEDPPDPPDLVEEPENKPAVERLFVHAGDSKRAREIVREILKAQPE
jgi:hypothetical protein